MQFFTEHPFISGLAIGCIALFYQWFTQVRRRSELTKKIHNLQVHLNTQMEITAKGNSSLLDEIKQLKVQNENLRISIQTWQQKPGRAEMRTLHIYDKALHLMLERAAGFSPIWENVLKEAEREVKESERGVRGLIKKVFSPATNYPVVHSKNLLEEK